MTNQLTVYINLRWDWCLICSLVIFNSDTWSNSWHLSECGNLIWVFAVHREQLTKQVTQLLTGWVGCFELKKGGGVKRKIEERGKRPIRWHSNYYQWQSVNCKCWWSKDDPLDGRCRTSLSSWLLVPLSCSLTLKVNLKSSHLTSNSQLKAALFDQQGKSREGEGESE